MRILRLALLLVVAAGCSSPPKKKSLTLTEMITMDPLPLARGSKWTYTVNVKRFDVDANKVTTKTIPWTTEVIDSKESNGITAFRVRGWPTDLNDYDGTGPVPTPTELTILRKDNTFHFGKTAEPTMDEARGWFDWPVVDGQKICPPTSVYCWQVSAVETGYKLSNYMDSEEESYELEPGTGVAKFRYVHHKSTNEIEAKLVSYNKPGAPKR